MCLDQRHHGTERLAYDGLASFQGPALLVYNNSVFTEEDFESISRVGGSKKRTQAGKTGRFGWVAKYSLDKVTLLEPLISIGIFSGSSQFTVWCTCQCTYFYRIQRMLEMNQRNGQRHQNALAGPTSSFALLLHQLSSLMSEASKPRLNQAATLDNLNL